MKTEYINGKIAVTGILSDEVEYDVTSYSIAARFDGKGGINYFSAFDDKIYFDQESALNIYIDGERIPVYTPKTVSMIGRMQTVFFETEKATVRIELFTEKSSSAVFHSVFVKAKKDKVDVRVAYYLRTALNDSAAASEDGYTCRCDKSRFSLGADKPVHCVGVNEMVLFEQSKCMEYTVRMAYGFTLTDPKSAVADFDRARETVLNEIASVKLPSSIKTERERAIYLSAYFCALENYIEKDDFKCFLAGCRYVIPLRTYFRDSYFTVLAMYNGNTEKVRNQILTLASGVEKDGNCPSAVRRDRSAHWGGHYDSPSMFCIMLYDYVNNTGDMSILDETVNGVTVLKKAVFILNCMMQRTDSTGLLVKKGPYNRRDWADEVNRNGYVTYDEILYARALYCMSVLCADKDKNLSKKYADLFVKVKQSINDILWDEKLGYYVNFKDGKYIENNLSIDTVLAVLFGIAEGDRAKRLVKQMEAILESRNHPELSDFGVMCVYPLYKDAESAQNKSARPFDYHNGSEWPYWSAMYAYAKRLCGMDSDYALTRWFDVNIENGNYTPVEYHSPYCKIGSSLQAWSSAVAFVYFDSDCTFFKNKL